MKFEIYERAQPQTVVDTIEVEDMKAFRTYWFAQCNTDEYGFREVGKPVKPYVLYVVEEQIEKDTHGEACYGQPVSYELDDMLCEQIAKGTNSMTADEVRLTLKRGQTIYTAFKRYTLENG